MKHAKEKISRMLDLQHAISTNNFKQMSFFDMYIELHSIYNELLSELTKVENENNNTK